ncbi:DUF922 domain-containing protein [Paraflavisolibacter sp. H34]|uniref:DUF922 domain-containing protein n=1 Tax=Huijunlia imazamoxiresistens TaxID=3127457 RepID=UPI003015ED37
MMLSKLLSFIFLVAHTTFVTPDPPAKTVTLKTASPNDEGSDYLPWLMSRKLTWDDFRCEPQRNMDAVALTSTSLGISYRVVNGRLSYEVSCHFSKTRSWGILKTPYILAHEQGHFDITEIFARKLHQQLQAYKYNKRTFRKDITKIYNQVVKEKEAFQESYDEETSHSRNKRVQKEWLNRIEEMLEQSDRFADYP